MSIRSTTTLLIFGLAAVLGQFISPSGFGESSEVLSKQPSAPPPGVSSQMEDCDPDRVGFELITGFVLSAPNNVLESIPGTLMLSDCLESCQANESCYAVNYETGLCVLFSTNADMTNGALVKSQFPVYTIYAQKNCLAVKPCERSWCVDRVQNYRLVGHVKGHQVVNSRQECMELCLGENEYSCRSANYNNGTGDCELSNMDRITLAGTNAFQPTKDFDYMENNCIEEPTKLCEFKKLTGRILKTVDSVFQDVGSLEECRELCLNSPYRCHSYDYGDTGEMVCRLSHHSRATLVDIQEPFLDVPEAATYELSSCYNVSIDCRSGDMVARIQTSKVFDGKIYAKGSPNSCVQDVNNSLEFELHMGYDDLECNVRKNGLGKYVNDVVIQHHDKIVTSSDLGLAVTCQYDLTNKSVTNEVDLGIHGDIEPSMSEEVTVDSPNVAMRITDRNGEDIMSSAEVGDPLALKFEIIDKNSPYEIFVRELVAMDGVDSSEIVLIDSRGCPTDHFIMGPIYKSVQTGKVLLSHFDAFKFPSSDIVQFRALVTPCMPTCEPIQCDQEESTGELRSVVSFGKRRRRRSVSNESSSSAREDLLLVQSIQITDKFGFENGTNGNSPNSDGIKNGGEATFIPTRGDAGICVNMAGIMILGVVFVVAQVSIFTIWSLLWQRKRVNHKLAADNLSFNVSIPSGLNSKHSDSLSKLYTSSGYSHSRRF